MKSKHVHMLSLLKKMLVGGAILITFVPQFSFAATVAQSQGTTSRPTPEAISASASIVAKQIIQLFDLSINNAISSTYAATPASRQSMDVLNALIKDPKDRMENAIHQTLEGTTTITTARIVSLESMITDGLVTIGDLLSKKVGSPANAYVSVNIHAHELDIATLLNSLDQGIIGSGPLPTAPASTAQSSDNQKMLQGSPPVENNHNDMGSILNISIALVIIALVGIGVVLWKRM